MQTSTSLRIAFDSAGAGEPALLLLPGWCAHRSVFGDLVQAAAVRRRTVALDWRGHGDSDPADGDYGTTELTDDATAVLDTAGIERVVPVGLSHAGWVALELRRRLGPDRVPAVVLLDWMVLGPPPPFLDALAGLQQRESWETVRRALFERWTTGVSLPALDASIAAMATHGFDDWARGGREIAAQFRAFGSPLTALDTFDPPCPTLHLYAQPADDEYLEAQTSYAAEHRWFSVERLDARSHFPMLEIAAEMATAIEGFVASL